LSENKRIVEYWQILSTFDRPPGFSGLTIVSSKSIRDFCSDYDLDEDAYEMILVLERNFILKHNSIQEEKSKREKANNG